jgi:serine/threonine protein kinase
MDISLDKFYLKAKSSSVRLDESFLARVAYSCLMGMSFLRSKKIMHRDIKPSNILMNRDGKIKLCDFGISGFITNSVCLTITGCCPYMSVSGHNMLVLITITKTLFLSTAGKNHDNRS